MPISDLMALGKEIAAVQSDQAVRPTARAGQVEWVVRSGGQAQLFFGRRPTEAALRSPWTCPGLR